MEERRSRVRARVLKSGKIAVSAKAPKIECTIRTLSEQGACLQVPSGTFGIPFKFDLLIEGGIRHPCQVVWRTDARIGVSFAEGERAARG